MLAGIIPLVTCYHSLMTQQPKKTFVTDIAGFNDDFADSYDKDAEAGGWVVNSRLELELKSRQKTIIQKALDLGCGTGQTVDVIKRIAPSSSIVAVDASSKMLVNLCKKYALPEIITEHNTIEDYVENCLYKFDLITAIGSLEFVQNLPKVLEKVAQLLSPGGTIVFTYIPHVHGTDRQRLFRFPSIGKAFVEYYWSADDISSSLITQGLAIKSEETFVAYKRGLELVTYTLLIARKA